MNLKQKEHLDDSIRDPLEAIRGTAILGSSLTCDVALAGAFHSIRILAENAIKATESLEEDAGK